MIGLHCQNIYSTNDRYGENVASDWWTEVFVCKYYLPLYSNCKQKEQNIKKKITKMFRQCVIAFSVVIDLPANTNPLASSGFMVTPIVKSLKSVGGKCSL